MMTEKTTVIFRKWPDGEIVALFPGDKADLEGNCLSYMHIGQHGAADYCYIIERTTPADIKEYKELKKELENIGYDLRIRKRWVRR